MAKSKATAVKVPDTVPDGGGNHSGIVVMGVIAFKLALIIVAVMRIIMFGYGKIFYDIVNEIYLIITDGLPVRIPAPDDKKGV